MGGILTNMDPGTFTLDETIEHAVDLAARAHALGIDMGEWFAQVAVRTDARLDHGDRITGMHGSPTGPRAPGAALLSNRTSSWEANLVRALIDGTRSDG